MDEPIFAVGQRYANAAWEYEVLEITGPRMVVRSDDGKIRTLDIEAATRIWTERQPKPKKSSGGRKPKATKS